MSVALMHINDNFPSAKDEVPDVPYQLERIIKKATEKYQSRRYKNVDDMIEDLKSISYIESRFGKKALYSGYGEDEMPEILEDESEKPVKVADRDVKKKNGVSGAGQDKPKSFPAKILDFLKSD